MVGSSEHGRRRLHLRRGRAGRRPAGIAALTALLVCLPASASTASAAIESDDVTAVADRLVRALTTETSPLVPGQSAWVSVVWAASRTVTGWSTTVTAPEGVTVTYPSTRGGRDTSLFGSDTLVGRTKDFTAFRLSVPYTQTRSFKIALRTTFSIRTLERRTTSWGYFRDWRDRDPNRSTVTTVTTVVVPVVPAKGPAFTQETTSLSIRSGSTGFEQISFVGGQADLANFSVRLGALPPGLAVAYPGDRASSGLNAGSTLVGGTNDYAGVRLIATDLPPGKYVIPIVVSYAAAARAQTTGQLVLHVS